jgi:hypothetical protein
MDNSIFSFEEVRRVEIRCACGVGVVFSLLPDSEDPEPKDTQPTYCPACRASLGTAAVAVKALRQFYFHAQAFTAERPNRRVELRHELCPVST